MKDQKRTIRIDINIKVEFLVRTVTVTMIAILKDQSRDINILKAVVKNIKNVDTEIFQNHANLIKNPRNIKAEEGW